MGGNFNLDFHYIRDKNTQQWLRKDLHISDIWEQYLNQFDILWSYSALGAGDTTVAIIVHIKQYTHIAISELLIISTSTDKHVSK